MGKASLRSNEGDGYADFLSELLDKHIPNLLRKKRKRVLADYKALRAHSQKMGRAYPEDFTPGRLFEGWMPAEARPLIAALKLVPPITEADLKRWRIANIEHSDYVGFALFFLSAHIQVPRAYIQRAIDWLEIEASDNATDNSMGWSDPKARNATIKKEVRFLQRQLPAKKVAKKARRK